MKPAIISRSYSDKYLPGKSDYDLFKNRNIDWLRGPFFKVFYITITLFSWVLVYSSGLFAWEDSWTTINMAHGVVSYFLLIYYFCLFIFIFSKFFRSHSLFSTGSRDVQMTLIKANIMP